MIPKALPRPASSFDIAVWAEGRTMPTPSQLSQPFWDGLRRGVLLVQRCEECAHHIFRPEFACIRCFSPKLTWVESTGRGTLTSHSVVHRAPHPSMATPFVVGVVRLDEGWHMMTNIVDAGPVDLRAGTPMRLRCEQLGDMVIPLFEPGS